VRSGFHPAGRIGAALTVAAAGSAGLAAYLVASPLLGGPSSRQLPALLRGRVPT
jgi:hypothetical protein